MNTQRRYFVVLVAVLLLPPYGTTLRAQSPSLRFDHVALAEGLSQSTVNAITQDGQGFMWFGTQDGLNRYDGYSVIVFRNVLGDSSSIADNAIWSMATDRAGNVWIGTMNGGLNRYDIMEGTFTRFVHDPADPASVCDNNVTAVYHDSRGDLWVGTMNGGLCWSPGGAADFVHYRYSEKDERSLANNTVWTICEDPQGNIWIGTWEGLCCLAASERSSPALARGEARFTRYLHDPRAKGGISGNHIRALHVDGRGALWIGTWGDGLNVFDAEHGRFQRLPFDPSGRRGIPSELILSLGEDKPGNMWIGTGDAGLTRVTRDRQIAGTYQAVHGDPASLNNDIVCALYSDWNGGIWIGTGAGGVNKFDWLNNRFQLFRTGHRSSGGEVGDEVWSLCEDGRGALWVGTYGSGLIRFDRHRQQSASYRYDPADPRSLSNNKVLAIVEGRDGSLWIGTEGGGLNLMSNGRPGFTRYRHSPDDPNSLSLDEITSMCESRDGRLWIGTNGAGLDCFDPKHESFTNFPHRSGEEGSLGGASVLSVFEDSRGDLWVGTWGGGLYRMQSGTRQFVRYRVSRGDSTGLSNATVLCIAEDGEGVIWLGTYGGGLNRLEVHRGRFSHFGVAEGLPNNVVYGIIPDLSGNLWLTTNYGLCRYTPRTGAAKTFSAADGLQGNEFNQGAYHRGRKGEIFVGGIGGFNAFFPDSLATNDWVPPVYLTDFRVFDRPVHLAQSVTSVKEVRLAHSQNFFSFEFVALNYTSPSRNRYAYMLEGLDRDWVEAGTRRYTSYTNLDPGDYVLRVRASNNDGVWNQTGIAVTITITPPYWRTWWFRLIAAGAVGSLLWLMYRVRVNKLLEIERLRASIASDLHDDIGSTLTEIALFSDVGLRELHSSRALSRTEDRQSLKVAALLREIGGTSRRLIDAMNDIVWSIDPKNDSFDQLLLRMKTHAARVLEAKGIGYEIEIPAELSHLKLPLGSRRRLFLIFKEAINNTLRHARATHVVLSMRRLRRALLMSIIDDGVGFDPGKTYEGNGLRNMKERAASMGGELDIRRIEPQGTSLTLSVPIP